MEGLVNLKGIVGIDLTYYWSSRRCYPLLYDLPNKQTNNPTHKVYVQTFEIKMCKCVQTAYINNYLIKTM